MHRLYANTTLFYIKDLGILRFSHPRRIWNQSPTDAEYYLRNVKYGSNINVYFQRWTNRGLLEQQEIADNLTFYVIFPSFLALHNKGFHLILAAALWGWQGTDHCTNFTCKRRVCESWSYNWEELESTENRCYYPITEDALFAPYAWNLRVSS